MCDYVVVGDVEAEVLVGDLIEDSVVSFELFDTGGGVLEVVVGGRDEGSDDEYPAEHFKEAHVDLNDD